MRSQGKPLSSQPERQTDKHRESQLTRAEGFVEASARVGKPEL